MKHSDKLKYESLGTIAERAAWLLDQGVSASLDIDNDNDTLSPVWRVSCAGVMLPQKFTGTEAEALRDAETWLREKAGLPNAEMSHGSAAKNNQP